MNAPAFGNNLDLFSQMAPWGTSTTYQAPPSNVSAMEMTPFQAQYLEAMKGMNQAPSAWQTGAQTFGTVTQGLASLAQAWGGLQNLKLQKEAFKFNKGVTNTNLNNSIMDYNRRLSDTLANRALNNGQGQGWVSEQLAKYSAKRG